MTWKKAVFAIFIVSILLIVNYMYFISNNNLNRNQSNNNIEKYVQKLENMKNTTVNKKLISFENILQNRPLNDFEIVFLYTINDCMSCVKKGFEICNEIDIKVKGDVLIVVTPNSNIGADQLRFNYKKYIYSDIHDNIRRELNYIVTPVFLLVGKNSEIISCYFPANYNDDVNKDAFLVKVDSVFIKNNL